MPRPPPDHSPVSPRLRARIREVPEGVDAGALLREMAREQDVATHVMTQVEQARAPTTAPFDRFLVASTVWACATFALCYIALPMAFAVAGIRPFQLLWTLPGELLAFGLTWSAFALWMRMQTNGQPSLPIDPHGLATSDRIPAAMAGGLLVWGLLHNVLPGLMGFGSMSMVFLAVFLISNLIENALFGTILATVTQTRRGAFTAGALLQATLGLAAWML